MIYRKKHCWTNVVHNIKLQLCVMRSSGKDVLSCTLEEKVDFRCFCAICLFWIYDTDIY